DERVVNLVKENLDKAKFYKEELDVMQIIDLYMNTKTDIKPYPLEIGQELDISYQLVVKIVKKLIDSDLVIRMEDQENRRRPY
ncbi:helix-turn-helix domain-containing protein, partial [Bacillus sp. SIMBA_161]